jgi:hypothetical protein
MIKQWIVTFKNLDNSVVKTDSFDGITKGEAIANFREVYRHAPYKIIEVKEC